MLALFLFCSVLWLSWTDQGYANNVEVLQHEVDLTENLYKVLGGNAGRDVVFHLVVTALVFLIGQFRHVAFARQKFAQDHKAFK